MIGSYALLRFMYRKKSLLHRGYPREVSGEDFVTIGCSFIAVELDFILKVISTLI